MFVYGNLADRLHRLVHDYGIPEEEAGTRLNQMDRGRANYYEHYTNEEWGSLGSFDLAVNTSFTGVDGAVEVLCTMAGL